METVLITGSNGFIGSYIAETLIKSNHYRVIGCGRRNVPHNRADMEYVRWNIGYEADPPNLPCRIDHIIHAAAVTPNAVPAEVMIQTNCTGTFSVAEYARRNKISSIIYLSGITVVGKHHTTPITEDSPVRPSTLYHSTKAAGEAIISQLSGIRTVIVRAPSPIGPGMPQTTILPVFINNAKNNLPLNIYGTGSRKQNYIDVRDLASAIKRLLRDETAKGIYNAGSKNVISNIDLARLCIQTLNSTSPIVYTGTPDREDNLDWTTDDYRLRSQIGNYQITSLRQSIIDIAS